jgi:ATP-dependent DNA helicase RecG
VGIDLREPLRATVGDKAAKALASNLGLHTVGELLRHYPRRYVERGELTRLDSLRVGEHVTVLAQVQKASLRQMKYRKDKILEVVVTDGAGSLVLTFFGKTAPWRSRELKEGRRGLFAGKVGEYNHKRQLTHPDYQLLGDELEDAGRFAGALIPVYPATAKLASWSIANALQVVLDTLGEPADPLPAELRERHRLVDLRTAYEGIHRPETRADVARATGRLKWDEALVLQVTLAQRRAAARATPAKPRVARGDGLVAAFDARLPFELTGGQQEVAATVAAEMAEPHPMYRLLQGEVGSGKTVVALRAMLAVADTGGQAALLAPTEVLAAQHERSIRDLLGPLGAAGELGAAETATGVALVTGSQGAAVRRRVLAAVESGEAAIVVGTHALLEEGVQFADLGLVVVDEQHRFGVEQRETLRSKGSEPPHVLVMTATPIPRTVAMTVYGDLEVSTLVELPLGRAPISTHVVPAESASWQERMWARVREEVAAGHQAFVVCPRIGESTAGASPAAEESDRWALDDEAEEGRRPAAAVLDVAPRLAVHELAGLRVAALHGRLPAEEKDRVMREFAAGSLDVLVATTVIEVGVDVPNAAVMVVLDADRFGVSQLHQLRGRVGRGSAPSWCLLETEAAVGTPGRDRLQGVADTLDGFVLARLDLEHRREGNVLGKEQSGRRSAVRLLSLLRDEELIRTARQEATTLVEADPELEQHPELARAIAGLAEEQDAEFLERA